MRILVTVNDNSIARNILRSGAFLKTLTSQGHSVVLVCTEALGEKFRGEFAADLITVETYTPYERGVFERVVAFLARNIFYSESNLFFQERAAVRGHSAVPLFVKQGLAKTLGRMRAWKWLVRFLDARISPHQRITTLFERVKPDVVFSTTIMDEVMDTPILREAKRRHIRTVGMTRSWDNLSSYGFFRVMPDTFIAQNTFLAQIAETLQVVPPERVHVVGDPYYDMFKRSDILQSREDFFHSIGVDPAKKLVLYAAIGDELFPHEGELSVVFEEEIEKGAIPNATHVLFRAHPAFASPLERMHNLQHVSPDRGATYAGGALATWDMDTSRVTHFINSLHHADVVVTAGSTVIIDAVGYGKPVVSVAFDGLSVVDPLFSVRSYVERTTHLRALHATGGFKLAGDRDELARYITRYLVDPALDTSERNALILRFASPQTSTAGVRVAEIVTSASTQ